MNCSKCGKEVYGEQIFCPECGHAMSVIVTGDKEDGYNKFGWGALGFCVPVMGVILYFVYRKICPRRAKTLLTWALISWGAELVLTIVMFAAAFLMGLAGAL